jgi:hypothetical protein
LRFGVCFRVRVELFPSLVHEFIEKVGRKFVGRLRTIHGFVKAWFCSARNGPVQVFVRAPGKVFAKGIGSGPRFG